MNYLKHYLQLCNSRRSLGRTKTSGVYYETHHIMPKSLGGGDLDENLVLFTPKEHYIAHLLLYKHYKGVGGEACRKMSFALVSMTSPNKNLKRIELSSKQYANIREAAILSSLGRTLDNTENYKKPKSQSHKDSIRNARYGQTFSEESKQKMSESAKRRGNNFTGNVVSVKCPHCKKEGQKNAMLRWHFDNCKEVKDAQLA